MKVPRSLLILALAAAWLAGPAQPATAQNTQDQIEAARAVLKADRQAVVAHNLQLTEAESRAFWPLYHQYRAAMDKVGDALLRLVLEHAQPSANVPEARARQLLTELGALEKKHAKTRADYLKRIAKVLPASKALRFAQLESRMDLALRLQLAAAIPLVEPPK